MNCFVFIIFHSSPQTAKLRVIFRFELMKEVAVDPLSKLDVYLSSVSAKLEGLIREFGCFALIDAPT